MSCKCQFWRETRSLFRQDQPPIFVSTTMESLSLRVQSGRHTLNASIDSSLQLTNNESESEVASSFCEKSFVSNDSFVAPPATDDALSDDGSIGSYDPYLSKRRRQRRRNQQPQLHYCTSPSKQRLDPKTPDTMDTLMSTDDENVAEPPTHEQVGGVSALDKRAFNDMVSLPPTMLEIPTKPSLIMLAKASARDDDSNTTTSTSSTLLRDTHRRTKAVHLRVYWNAVVSSRVKQYGTLHSYTAQGLLDLGHAHMQCREYKDALNVFTSAVRVFRSLFGDSDLRVATALDKLARAAWRHSKSDKALTFASVAVHESLQIRFDILGATHVDTVETLNHLAAIHLEQGEIQEALQTYLEVYTVRKYLFGATHPSVAVAASMLGGVYRRLAKLEDAWQCCEEALEIYRRLSLSPENPVMVKLLKDMRSIERIMSTRIYL